MIVDQTEFRVALLDPERDHPTGLVDGAGRPAGRRFDVYRNNVAVSLTEALETAFPVIRKLVGENNFKTLAGNFLRETPPESPFMMDYGAALPAFLERFAPTAQIGYLADIARLEIALRESYHAEDIAPLDPAVLQGFPPERLLATAFTLAPSVRLVRSSWPIHAIWRFNIEPLAPKPEMTAQDVLVLRPEFDPAPHLLGSGGGVVIAALLGGQTLEAAIDSAATINPEFDASGVVSLLLANGAVTALGETE